MGLHMSGFPANDSLREQAPPRASPIRVLIAEETPMGAQLLKAGLKRPGIPVGEIYCALTSAQIIASCASHPVDVAIISEDLQDGTYKGLDAIGLLRKVYPGVRSILLVKKLRRELTLDAFRNGAKGVFCRTEPLETLAKCIRVVQKGQIWIDSAQLEVVLQALIDTKPVHVTNLQGAGLLTKREDQVAGLVAEGLTNKEIAKRLGLSEHTVSNYLFKIYEKIGISSRVEFVLYVFGCRQHTLDNAAPPAEPRKDSLGPRI